MYLIVKFSRELSEGFVQASINCSWNHYKLCQLVTSMLMLWQTLPTIRPSSVFFGRNCRDSSSPRQNSTTKKKIVADSCLLNCRSYYIFRSMNPRRSFSLSLNFGEDSKN